MGDNDDDTVPIQEKGHMSFWFACCIVSCGLPFVLLFILILVALLTRWSSRRKK